MSICSFVIPLENLKPTANQQGRLCNSFWEKYEKWTLRFTFQSRMPLYGYLVSKDSFLYCCGKPFHLTRLIGTPANAHIDTFFLLHSTDFCIKLWRNPFGNWVILIFRGQQPCTRRISSTLHTFLHFSRAKNVISYMKQHQRNGFYGSLRKQTSKFHKVNEFTVFSQFLGNLKFMNFFRPPIRNCL